MTSSPESEHLDNRHRNTLRQIFQHPVSHNIEWHAVTSLLDAIGSVDVHHDGQVAVRVGSESAFFTHPEGKDIDEQMVVDLRRLLSKAGYSLRSPGPSIRRSKEDNLVPNDMVRNGAPGGPPWTE